MKVIWYPHDIKWLGSPKRHFKALSFVYKQSQMGHFGFVTTYLDMT